MSQRYLLCAAVVSVGLLQFILTKSVGFPESLLMIAALVLSQGEKTISPPTDLEELKKTVAELKTLANAQAVTNGFRINGN